MGLWSADSQWFLTHRIDERASPETTLIQHVPPGGGRPLVHSFKYTMPHDAVPMATYVAIHVATGRVVPFDDFPATVMAYSPFIRRTVWFGSDNSVWFIRFDRYSRRAQLVHFDLANGQGRVILEETVPTGYLELHPIGVGTPNVRTLVQSDEVIWFSERDGWGHLYLHDASTGKLKNRITQGEWLVRDIVRIDEQQRRLFFLAAGIDPDADPARRALCSVNLDGTGFELLLIHDDGDIFVVPAEPCGIDQDRPFRPSYAHVGLSPSMRFVLVRYASVRSGNRTEIVELSTRTNFTIASASPRPGDVRPRHFSALAADGVTRLHGTMFLPPDFDERLNYALIDHIYPGPQILQQPQSFMSVNAAQSRVLAELGFVTIMLDSRRMAVGSRASHQIGYGGPWEEPQLADHAAVIRQLNKRFSFIDGKRIGVIGQSGGGTAVVRALCDYGDVFKVGVAACGVYDNRFYSTHWSDKYCGPADGNASNDRSLAAVAHKLTGKLLLISGDMDENVHLSQTLSLANSLILANRDFDLLIVPNAGHSVLMRVFTHSAVSGIISCVICSANCRPKTSVSALTPASPCPYGRPCGASAGNDSSSAR